MLQNSWSIKLPDAVNHITVGYLPEPSFIFYGASKQLSVYTNNQTTPLPIRKEVLSLATINNTQILILTRFSLSCFDLLRNQQRFSLEFENAQQLYVIDSRLYVVCGGILYCYDENGQQDYVNHISESIVCVGSVAQSTDIVIATENLIMNRFDRNNIVFDYGKIAGTATVLCWHNQGVIVGTRQGSIALYESKKSKWKFKSSHAVTMLIHKGHQIIVMRNNGHVQVRSCTDGVQIYKVSTKKTIITGFLLNFRQQNSDQIVCVLESGKIRAYNYIQGGEDAHNNKTQKPTYDQLHHQIQSLKIKRAELAYELETLKQSSKQQQGRLDDYQGPIVASDFIMKASLEYRNGLNLKIACKNGYMSGLTFEEPIMPILFERTQQYVYVFEAANDVAGVVNCQLLAHSTQTSNRYEIRTLKINLPKFWKWGITQMIRAPQGRLRCHIIERNARYLKWAKQCFFISDTEKQEQALIMQPVMILRFHNSYTDQVLELIFSQSESSVQINCDCLKTMGDILQDLVNFIGIKDLNTELDMPKEKEKIKQLLAGVESLVKTKVSISTEVADVVNTIKFLLVKGQSARLVGSMDNFRKSFADLMTHNRDLLTEIEKKNMNAKVLSQSMKTVGQFINKIANVRYGKSKTQIISQCREAIKTKKFPQIIRLMDQGIELNDQY